MIDILSTGTFDMTRMIDGFEITSDGLRTLSATELQWNMFDPNYLLPGIGVQLFGTGFGFLDGAPSAGVVTEIRIDLDRLSFGDPVEATITGFSIALADLLDFSGTVDLKLEELVADVMGGNDDLSLGDASFGFGDQLDVEGGTVSFGKDTMTLTGEDGTLWGDARTLSDGAVADGGNDVLKATGLMADGLRLIGEVQTLSGSTLTGGNDKASITASETEGAGFVQSLVVGDAQEVIGASLLTGGDDTLSGSAALSDRLFGDVEIQDYGAPVVIGGDDLLKGRAGNDFLYGDVDAVAAGSLTGGADTLYGGSGDDFLFGDYGRITGGTVVGGDDQLYGKAGRDAMLGQGGNDLLKGGSGADTITGDGGADTLNGGSGDDSLYGGADGDTMYGGSGADRFIWQGVEDLGERGNRDVIGNFESGVDTIDLKAVAQDAGGLTWVGGAYDGTEGTIGYAMAGARLKLQANFDDIAGEELVILLTTGPTDLLPSDVVLT